MRISHHAARMISHVSCQNPVLGCVVERQIGDNANANPAAWMITVLATKPPAARRILITGVISRFSLNHSQAPALLPQFAFPYPERFIEDPAHAGHRVTIEGPHLDLLLHRYECLGDDVEARGEFGSRVYRAVILQLRGDLSRLV